jgi:hypothetical protein
VVDGLTSTEQNTRDRIYFGGLVVLTAVLTPLGGWLWPPLGTAFYAIVRTTERLAPRGTFSEIAGNLLVIGISVFIAALGALAARRFLSRGQAWATAGELTVYGAFSVVLALANAAFVALWIFLWINND